MDGQPTLSSIHPPLSFIITLSSIHPSPSPAAKIDAYDQITDYYNDSYAIDTYSGEI